MVQLFRCSRLARWQSGCSPYTSVADTNERDIQEREVIVGIVTDIDLLQHIARHEAGSGSDTPGSASPGNAKGNGV